MKLLIVIAVLVAGTVGDLLIGDGRHVRAVVAVTHGAYDSMVSQF